MRSMIPVTVLFCARIRLRERREGERCTNVSPAAVITVSCGPGEPRTGWRGPFVRRRDSVVGVEIEDGLDDRRVDLGPGLGMGASLLAAMFRARNIRVPGRCQARGPYDFGMSARAAPPQLFADELCRLLYAAAHSAF